MKISKSKQELARIVSENGGWRDGEFAAQDGDGGVGGYEVKPEWDSLAKYWWREAFGEWFLADKIKNHHQTVLSRAEYLHLYPVPDADGWIEWKGGGCPVKTGELVDIRYRDGEAVFGAAANEDESDAGAAFWRCDDFQCDIIAYRLHKPGQAKPEFCESVMRSIPEPETKPSIEQLASDHRNPKDYAERKQKEADDAKADAEAKLAELVAAGEGIGLVLSVAAPEPELVIADWRDLQVGDEIEYVDGLISKRIGLTGVVDRFQPDATDGMPVGVVLNGSGKLAWPAKWRFIRRP